MGKWSSILKLGSKAANSSAARTVGGAVIHPQRTLMGVGAATKTAVVGTGMGYVAWESIVNDKPVVRTIGDTLIGEKAVDKTVDAASSVADTVSTVTGKVGGTLKSVNEATSSVTETWGGIGSFLRNITGGNGLNMFGNLFNNIAGGNVSGMSMLGLLLSGLLVFGRFGWMGKIAGALMGMMLIGGNSQSQNVAQAQEVSQSTGLKR